MIATKKAKLIRKHLGINTPEWIVKNCIALLQEYEEIEWCGESEKQANGADTRAKQVLPKQNVIFSVCKMKSRGFCPYEKPEGCTLELGECINQTEI